MDEINIFWYRRDLRLHDNAGLYRALKEGIPVVPLFIFDKEILDKLEDKKDRRVEFIYDTIRSLREDLGKMHNVIEVHYGFPAAIFEQLLQKYKVRAVFTNHDYEPYARKRDSEIAEMLHSRGLSFRTFKDHVIFEKNEVLKDNGGPYTVFTPYSNKWRGLLNDFQVKSYPVEKYQKHFSRQDQLPFLTLKEMGFIETGKTFPGKDPEDALIRHYSKTRDFPGVEGTSRISVHLRFGTISIRQLTARARNLNATYLNEIIWRDFYQSILWHFPRVGEHQAFKPIYENIEWRNNEEEFSRWCEGKTGYPIVDAGMRELNETGFMHNRVRMVVASFLIKHLLIDWRWGEAYFAQKLLDFDLAANNGGWQWAAGSGCDAAPYFRIFNPYLQTKKFDPELKYISKWVPEHQDFRYPTPIVDHDFARKRAIEVFSKAVKTEKA